MSSAFKGFAVKTDGSGWREAGGPSDTLPGEVFTATQPAGPRDNPEGAIMQALTEAVQAYVDAPAKAWEYDDARSAVSYVGDPDPQFSSDGSLILAFRSACWIKSRQVRAQVAADFRPVPTPEELIAEMPPQPTRIMV